MKKNTLKTSVTIHALHELGQWCQSMEIGIDDFVEISSDKKEFCVRIIDKNTTLPH